MNDKDKKEPVKKPESKPSPDLAEQLKGKSIGIKGESFTDTIKRIARVPGKED